MKNKVLKRMVAIFLAMSIVMCLTSCSGKDDEKQKDGGKQVASVDKNYKVGDYITFGSYEQDNDVSNGKEPIEWLVLDKQDGKVLVISKYGLDCQTYNTEHEDITWETCTLRTWLNNEFINNAFSSAEQGKIMTSTVSADKNPSYDTDPGNATQDKVFLLSITEASEYFTSDKYRRCDATPYAIANGASYFADYGSSWWLRSPGSVQHDAVYIADDGEIKENGGLVFYSTIAVRPAMWITL